MPSKPLWPSGKKGVPRVEPELSPLPGGGPIRHLSAPAVRQPGRPHPLRPRLLPLSALRAGARALGPDVARLAAMSDPGGRGSDDARGDPGELRQGGRADAGEAGRPAVERVHRRAGHGSGRRGAGGMSEAGRGVRAEGRLGLARRPHREDLRLRERGRDRPPDAGAPRGEGRRPDGVCRDGLQPAPAGPGRGDAGQAVRRVPVSGRVVLPGRAGRAIAPAGGPGGDGPGGRVGRPE
jgi:hypothetical protein